MNTSTTLKADGFELELNDYHLGVCTRLISVSGQLFSSNIVIQNFLINFEVVKLNGSAARFVFLVKTRAIEPAMFPSISKLSNIPTLSIIDSSGEWEFAEVAGQLLVKKKS